MTNKKESKNIAVTLDVKEQLQGISKTYFEPMGVKLSYNQVIKHLLSQYEGPRMAIDLTVDALDPEIVLQRDDDLPPDSSGYAEYEDS